MTVRGGWRKHSWTTQEMTTLRRLYPTADWQKIDAALVPHSHRSIVRMASTLKLHRRRTLQKSDFRCFQQLWRLREAKVMTREEVAKIGGFHPMMLGRWERGEQRPSIGNTERWCAALGAELVIEQTLQPSLQTKRRRVSVRGKARNEPASAAYLSLVPHVRARILELGWTMQKCDDKAGLQDGYTAKLLHPNSPEGRIPSWPILQLLLDALWPDGCLLRVEPASDAYGDRAFVAPARGFEPRSSGSKPDILPLNEAGVEGERVA